MGLRCSREDCFSRVVVGTEIRCDTCKNVYCDRCIEEGDVLLDQIVCQAVDVVRQKYTMPLELWRIVHKETVNAEIDDILSTDDTLLQCWRCSTDVRITSEIRKRKYPTT